MAVLAHRDRPWPGPGKGPGSQSSGLPPAPFQGDGQRPDVVLKVRALTRVATPQNEAELLEVARCSTAAHIEKLVRTWRYVDRLEGAEEEERRHQSRYLRLHPDNDGTYVLRGRLDPEVGALLEKALEWAGEALYREAAGSPEGEQAFEGPPQPVDAVANLGQRRADAVGLLAELALAAARSEEPEDGQSEKNGPTPNLGRAGRFQVVLHADVPSLKKEADDRQPVFIEGGVGVSDLMKARVGV